MRKENIKEYVFRKFYIKEYEELMRFRLKEESEEKEKRKKEERNVIQMQYLKEHAKELSDCLYRTIGNTVKIALDGIHSHEQEYELIQYSLSVHHRSIRLYLRRNKEDYTIGGTLNTFKIEYNNRLQSGLIQSKVHFTLDENPTRMYLTWDESINIPEENYYFEGSEKLPYESYSGVEYWIEKEKYMRRGNYTIIKGKYGTDKCNVRFGLLLKEDKFGNGSIYTYTDGYDYKTGSIEYEINDNEMEIVDTSQGDPLKIKADYGKLYYSTRRRGHGKAAMTFLLSHAKEIGVKRVYGNLSWVDEEDEKEKEWRNGYYKNLGFVINDGTVELNLETWKPSEVCTDK